MTELRFTLKAEEDILSAHSYTVAEFGAEQWNAYERGLQIALSNIQLNPEIGVDCSAVRQNVRRLLYRSHVIYYRVEQNYVLVLRVLGVRQDPGRHL